jgi:phosphopantothenoylcysteine decarboxylase/phosphopantothenate--cysteine ligase
MNVRMWQNAATRANVETLEARGIVFVMPASGRLACGDIGEGKLAEVETIVDRALSMLDATQSLAGRHVLVTAGPTHEPVDPVRFLANASSGKMGFEIARAARRSGAHVTLVCGPVSLPDPCGVDVIHVTTAAEMLEASSEAFQSCDAAVLAAAVADYTPTNPSDHKLKKRDEALDSIPLTRTKDILATLSKTKGERVVIGFAAETNDLVENAREKLTTKGCDLIIANDVSREDSTFGSDTDAVTIVSTDGAEELPTLSKREVAERIVEMVSKMIAAKGDATC